MEKKEAFRLIGKLTIMDTDTGKILYEKCNMVVDSGLALAASRIVSNTLNAPSHIAVGDGLGATTPSMTALVNELDRKPSVNTYTSNSFRITALFNNAAANFTWKEVGIFNAPVAGTMFNRVETSFTKTASMNITAFFEYNVIRS